MKIVITGGLGLIGQNLAHKFRSHSSDVHLTSIDWLDAPQAHEIAPFDTHISACFASPTAFEAYRSADVIIHLAASVSVQDSIDTPVETFHNNATKILSMMEFLRQNALRPHIIFASTGGAIVGDHDAPIDENTPAHPKSAYGASKLAAEAILDSFSQSYGFSCTCLRFSNVYGPRGPRSNNVISLFCDSVIASNAISITGDGKQTRDFIYSGDVTAAIIKFVDSDLTGVFQLGTETATSINELGDIFASLSQSGALEITHTTALGAEVRHNVSNTSKIRSALGFEADTKLSDGIEETLEWYRSNFDSLLTYRATN